MPGLVINTNVASLNAQRNLQNNSTSLNQSLERLSSGLRINHASDDAAGLAISDNMQSQINGLNAAVQNCNDGVSLVQTADGAMDTYTSILQRIRQLAVQASSDVNSDDNRQALQAEVSQQLSELNRIASTTQFNGQNLLDGTFDNRRIQAGADSGQTLLISVGDLRTGTIGSVATVTGTQVDNTALKSGDVKINGISVPSSASSSATDKAAAINAIYAQTGVTATAEPAQIVGTGAITAGTMSLAAGDILTINGVSIPSTGTITVAANDATGTLTRAINAVSTQTGVQASVNAAGKLVLTAVDQGTTNFTINTASANSSTITALGTGTNVDSQVNGTLNLSSDSAFTVANGTGTALTQLGVTGSVAVVPASAINTVDISTYAGAQAAIIQCDNALRQVDADQAGIGALSNRLQNTISNLQITSENMSASESQIRDADFAAETANLTRAQILQQSGVAVLAQANNTPQAALSLLPKS